MTTGRTLSSCRQILATSIGWMVNPSGREQTVAAIALVNPLPVGKGGGGVARSKQKKKQAKLRLMHRGIGG